MRTEDFDYPLPEELIAQQPAEPRDSARMLVLHRETGKIEHRVFRDIVDYLGPNDVLIRNDTRVVPARLRGRKQTGGKVEALLLRRHTGFFLPLRMGHGEGEIWEALVRPAGRLHSGSIITFDAGVEAEIVAEQEEGTRLLRFPEGSAPDRLGETPLPPYIHEPVSDPERYQTVYAREPGSAAAPTAGLHFTPGLLERLQVQGVDVVSLTLHIGLDTFRPVRHDDPREHGIHQEFYQLIPEAAARLTSGAQRGKRFICTGTTSVRALEDAVLRSEWRPDLPRKEQPSVRPYAGMTGLYILPGHHFLAVETLITNFHLPRTTLLMLVSAFAGRDTILNAYHEAIRERYRFYSFGDALLIL